MPFIRLHSPDDRRLSDYAGFRDPLLASSRGLFVAEGRLVVARLLQEARFHVRSMLLGDAAFRALEPALDALDPAVPVYLAEPDVFTRVTGVHVHRGCLALVERPPARHASDVLTAARMVVVLEAVGNADNVGGVFRNALALGGDGVLLSPTCCDPLYRKAIRTSMGATLALPYARLDPWPDALALLERHGFCRVALTPDVSATSIDAFTPAGSDPGRVALLLGAEGPGLSEAALGEAAQTVRIPMRAGVDSLNIAVAAGIALHRLSPRGG